ncbi:hypothetical protein K439DRAFT_1639370 [Ramaria rubella]|nr:hypothetical protein K439DRAFT_1639370 [Ramaria rubella]
MAFRRISSIQRMLRSLQRHCAAPRYRASQYYVTLSRRSSRMTALSATYNLLVEETKSAFLK